MKCSLGRIHVGLNFLKLHLVEHSRTIWMHDATFRVSYSVVCILQRMICISFPKVFFVRPTLLKSTGTDFRFGPVRASLTSKIPLDYFLFELIV